MNDGIKQPDIRTMARDARRFGVFANQETQALPCTAWAILQPDDKLQPRLCGVTGYVPELFATRNLAHIEARRREKLNPHRRMCVVRVRLERA